MLEVLQESHLGRGDLDSGSTATIGSLFKEVKSKLAYPINENVVAFSCEYPREEIDADDSRILDSLLERVKDIEFSQLGGISISDTGALILEEDFTHKIRFPDHAPYTNIEIESWSMASFLADPSTVSA